MTLESSLKTLHSNLTLIRMHSNLTLIRMTGIGLCLFMKIWKSVKVFFFIVEPFFIFLDLRKKQGAQVT